tara:strand:+ start:1980 stop:2450 length:471 start_codon:yes stop_codon:yes gene_type:complete
MGTGTGGAEERASDGSLVAAPSGQAAATALEGQPAQPLAADAPQPQASGHDGGGGRRRASSASSSASSSSDAAGQSAASDVEESKRLSDGSVASGRASIGPDGQPKFKQKKRRTHQSRANGLSANSTQPASSGGGGSGSGSGDAPAPVANEDALAC